MKAATCLSVMLVTACVNAHSHVPKAPHLRRPDLYEPKEFSQGKLGATAEPEPEFANARTPYEAGMKPRLKKF